MGEKAITHWGVIQELTPEKLVETFRKASKTTGDGVIHQPFTWLELCSALDVTAEELVTKAKFCPTWKRIVTLYQQKCQASVIAGLKNPKLNQQALLKFYELEYLEKPRELEQGWILKSN